MYSGHHFNLVIESAKRQQNAYDYAKKYGKIPNGSGKRKLDERNNGSYSSTLSNSAKKLKFGKNKGDKRQDYKKQDCKKQDYKQEDFKKQDFKPEFKIPKTSQSNWLS